MSNEFTDPEDPRQILIKANATLIAKNADLKTRYITAEKALLSILRHATEPDGDCADLLQSIADIAQEALAGDTEEYRTEYRRIQQENAKLREALHEIEAVAETNATAEAALRRIEQMAGHHAEIEDLDIDAAIMALGAIEEIAAEALAQ